MKFNYNDGGRSEAGYKGHTGDCGTRAIAIVTGLPYQEVYEMINKLVMSGKGFKQRKTGKVSNPRTGVWQQDMNKIMTSLGFKWHPTMFIGQGCKVHLNENELPQGRLLVNVSRHFTAVIDGVINDTYNPSERGATIYPLGYPKEQLPKGAIIMENSNGYSYKPERCVYGYYIKQ